jgi:hypothetical protein
MPEKVLTSHPPGMAARSVLVKSAGISVILCQLSSGWSFTICSSLVVPGRVKSDADVVEGDVEGVG